MKFSVRVEIRNQDFKRLELKTLERIDETVVSRKSGKICMGYTGNELSFS